MQHIDQSNAECFVFTFKEGLLAAVAHDLKIKVTRFDIDVDEDAQTLHGSFDPTSLRVVCAMQDGSESKGTLSAAQKKEIEANIVRDVLETEKFPAVRFASSSVIKKADGFRIKGQLSLHGKRKTIEATLQHQANTWVARARLNQPAFNIRPYSALFGTLKVQADVDIELVVPWPR